MPDGAIVTSVIYEVCDCRSEGFSTRFRRFLCGEVLLDRSPDVAPFSKRAGFSPASPRARFSARRLAPAAFGATRAGRDMHVLLPIRLLPLALGPVATRAVAAGEKISKRGARFSVRDIAIQIARQVAAEVAVAALGAVRAPARRRITPMGDAAEMEASLQHRETGEDPVTPDGAEAEHGTAVPPGMDAVGAAEALARREVTLIRRDCGEYECAHACWLFRGRGGFRVSGACCRKSFVISRRREAAPDRCAPRFAEGPPPSGRSLRRRDAATPPVCAGVDSFILMRFSDGWTLPCRRPLIPLRPLPWTF